MNAATLDQLKNRLTDNLPGERVFFSFSDDPLSLPYKAFRGVHIVLGNDNPDEDNGAGRWGMKSARNIAVHIVTQAYTTEAGSNFAEVRRHLELELAVKNALQLYGDTAKRPVGFLIIQTNSGEPRRVKDDVGLMRSMLTYRVSYVAALTNTVE